MLDVIQARLWERIEEAIRYGELDELKERLIVLDLKDIFVSEALNTYTYEIDKYLEQSVDAGIKKDLLELKGDLLKLRSELVGQIGQKLPIS